MQNTKPWDYLVVTAANQQQAEGYEFQLRMRESAGELACARNFLVVTDLQGKRIGSGGSTLLSLHRILARECAGQAGYGFAEAEQVLARLRILIIHAGGDSRRLPPYSHCGKLFVPLPDKFSARATTLFDRLVPNLLSLPARPGGQIVVASGDALILFDPSTVDVSQPGITALGCLAPAQEAAHHGVFCRRKDGDGSVTRYLQKPSPEEQLRVGAVNDAGHSILDLGVMDFDQSAALQLLHTFFTESGSQAGRELVLQKKALDIILSRGIDLYREICCALGSDSTLACYTENLQVGYPVLEREQIAEWFESLREIPLHVRVLPSAKFLHFGTTRQLISSGIALREEDSSHVESAYLVLNSEVDAQIACDSLWMEACTVRAPLHLGGLNVIVGADILEPLHLPNGACFDLSEGTGLSHEPIWFFRWYHIDDSFKHAVEEGGTLCGVRLDRWMQQMNGSAENIWPAAIPARERTLWNARVFPGLADAKQFGEWLWLFDSATTTTPDAQKRRFWQAERYSSSEIALRVNHSQFYQRRAALMFRGDSRSLQPLPQSLLSM